MTYTAVHNEPLLETCGDDCLAPSLLRGRMTRMLLESLRCELLGDDLEPFTSGFDCIRTLPIAGRFLIGPGGGMPDLISSYCLTASSTLLPYSAENNTNFVSLPTFAAIN